MKKSEIVAAAIAALASGTISVEAFADAPERVVFDQFGVELDTSSIDEIGREYEFLLAQNLRDRTLPRGTGKIPRLGVQGGTSNDGPVYRCLTCI